MNVKVENVCASVRRHYLISDLNLLSRPSFSQWNSRFRPEFEPLAEIRVTPLKTTLFARSGWLGQRREFHHTCSPCTENFILFHLIRELWYNFDFFQTTLGGWKNDEDVTCFWHSHWKKSYDEESLTRPLFVFEKVSFAVIILVFRVKLK